MDVVGRVATPLADEIMAAVPHQLEDDPDDPVHGPAPYRRDVLDTTVTILELVYGWKLTSADLKSRIGKRRPPAHRRGPRPPTKGEDGRPLG